MAEGDFSLTTRKQRKAVQHWGAAYGGPRLLNICGAYDGQYIIVQSTNNACVSLRWFRDTFGREAAREARAAGCGIYPYLDRLAALPRQGGGLMASYLAGAEPVWDTRQRRVLWSRAGDRLPVIRRAVLEGWHFRTAALPGGGPGPGCQAGYHTPWRRRGQQPSVVPDICRCAGGACGLAPVQ
ncbi:MAG: hypothetical protein ACLR0U_18265 [Enterocloster clostridioformis]